MEQAAGVGRRLEVGWMEPKRTYMTVRVSTVDPLVLSSTA